MFFRHHITVIYVTRGKIRSAVFSTGGKIIKEVKTYDWNEKNIKKILDDIISRGPNVARVVFGEEFSYVTTLSSSGSDRASVLSKAREAIPDTLEKNWDFKKNKDVAFSSQIAAVQTDTLDFFVTNFEKVGFRVEAIEPQSVAVARLLPKTGTFMFIANDEKVLMGAVNNGVVVATYILGEKEDGSILERFIAMVQKKYNKNFETVLVPEQTELTEEIFLAKGLKSKVLDLDPLYAVSIKKHLSGEDSRVLNITPTKQKSTGTGQVSEKQVKNNEKAIQSEPRFSLREKMLLVLFVALIIAGVILIKTKHKSPLISIANIAKKQVTVQNNISVSQTEQSIQPQQHPVETARQDVISIKKPQDLNILILNGGGVPGSAGKVKDTLATNGYLNIEAKNASSSNNTGVIVYYQASNADNANKIKEDLLGKYPKASIAEAVSDEQKSAEIVIILGK